MSAKTWEPWARYVLKFLNSDWILWMWERLSSREKISFLHMRSRLESRSHSKDVKVRELTPPEVKTHYSNIPAFQHSNWGEAPIINLQLQIGKFLSCTKWALPCR